MADKDNLKSIQKRAMDPDKPIKPVIIKSDNLLEGSEPVKNPTKKNDKDKDGKRSLTKAAYIKKHKHSKDHLAPQGHGHGHTKHMKHVPHRSFENPVSSAPRSKEDIKTVTPLQMEPVQKVSASKMGSRRDVVREQGGKKPTMQLTRPNTAASSKNSSVDFIGLVKRNQSVVAEELKKILLVDSDVSVMPERKAQWRREHAAFAEQMRREAGGDESPDEGISCACCGPKKPTQPPQPKEEKLDTELTCKEKVVEKFQKVAKWAVVLIGVMDFCMAIDDVYQILLRQMRMEFFFVQKIYNCNVYMPYGYMVILGFHFAHGLISLLLLFMTNKKTAGFGLYWIISQIALFYAVMLQGFFKSRFLKWGAIYFVEFWGPRFLIDLVQLFIVGFRFYKLYNPFHLRLRELAAAATTDRSMNNELHLRTSPFLQSKAAVRQAATFETLAVFNRMKEIYRSTGNRPDARILQEEIEKAIQLLNDRAKFPKRKVLSDISEEFRSEAARQAQEAKF